MRELVELPNGSQQSLVSNHHGQWATLYVIEIPMDWQVTVPAVDLQVRRSQEMREDSFGDEGRWVTTTYTVTSIEFTNF